MLVAAQERGIALDAILLNGVPRFVDLERPVTVNASGELADDVVEKLAGARRVFAFLTGLDHQSLGLREHPQPFDFVLEEEPDLPLEPAAELVPADAMYRALKQRAESPLRSLARIAGSSGGDVVLVESPPPPAAAWLAARRKKLARMTKEYKRSGKTNPVAEELLMTPTPRHTQFVRYKLWRLNSRIFSDSAAELGVRVAPCPPAAIDGEGFLRAEFCGDPIHGNAAYGALVLDQMGSFA